MKPILNKIVELKHWQVFALIILPIFNPGVNSIIDGMLLLCSITFFLLWILSIGLVLNDLLPSSKKANSSYFLVSAGFIFFYLVFILFLAGGAYVINNYEEHGIWAWLIIPLHVYSMWSMFYMFYFSAKVISRLNIVAGKSKGSTTANYFFGFWFYFIGIWIIQPKIQELLTLSAGEE